MKKSVFFLIGIFICVCASTALAQQPLSQQKLIQPLQLTTSTVKINKFLSILQTVTSLKEVQTAFIQASFSQDEVKQLKARIEASPTLKQKLDSLYNQVKEAAKIESAKKTTEEARQVAIVNAQLNQSLMTAHQESTNKIKVSTAAILDPEVRCQADTPSISEVSAVMPGVEFAVRGMGFGKDPGTVDVMAGGFVYPARINRWNSCVAYAQLSADIQGVKQDNQAAVSLKTSAGREARFYTRFTPRTEVRYFYHHVLLEAWFWGASKDYTFWKGVLKNDWYVTETNIWTSGPDGHAEITHSPPINTPNCSTETRVHAGVPAFGGLNFSTSQYIAGPKGIPPY